MLELSAVVGEQKMALIYANYTRTGALGLSCIARAPERVYLFISAAYAARAFTRRCIIVRQMINCKDSLSKSLALRDSYGLRSICNGSFRNLRFIYVSPMCASPDALNGFDDVVDCRFYGVERPFCVFIGGESGDLHLN